MWNQLKNIFTANGDCGCKTKSTEVFEPKPKSKASSFSDGKRRRRRRRSSATSSTVEDDEDFTSTTFSINIGNSPEFYLENRSSSSKTVRSCPKIKNSIAVVKDSDDPYVDFRRSMLQMIFERELYSRSDLQQLLDCFLQLNSPQHHEIIVRAFLEIWNGGSSDCSPEFFAGGN